MNTAGMIRPSRLLLTSIGKLRLSKQKRGSPTPPSFLGRVQ